MVDTEIFEDVGVSVRRSQEIHVSQHHEEQSFRQSSQHGYVYRDRFGAGPEDESLERHRGHYVSGIDLLQRLRHGQNE